MDENSARPIHTASLAIELDDMPQQPFWQLYASDRATEQSIAYVDWKMSLKISCRKREPNERYGLIVWREVDL
jgi:hypothetical protein